MTFDIGLNGVWVRVGGVRYVKTEFSRMDSLPNFVTHGAPLRYNLILGFPGLKLVQFANYHQPQKTPKHT